MLLSRIFIIIFLIISGWRMPELSNINDYFIHSNNITIYNNGNTCTYNHDTQEFNDIIDSINNMCNNSHEMPAFGVSLHKETLIAIQTGIWIELEFNSTITHNDMPFSKLIFEINPEYSGFNIIRYCDNKYEGRCYYLNLDSDMSELYSLIKSYIM